MNLKSRVSRLEEANPRGGRIVALWALDKSDLQQKTSKMRASGEIGPDDTIVVTMWGLSGNRTM